MNNVARSKEAELNARKGTRNQGEGLVVRGRFEHRDNKNKGKNKSRARSKSKSRAECWYYGKKCHFKKDNNSKKNN